jgi:hypothetical protein
VDVLKKVDDGLHFLDTTRRGLTFKAISGDLLASGLAGGAETCRDNHQNWSTDTSGVVESS